jgi:hypothetical protein
MPIHKSGDEVSISRPFGPAEQEAIHDLLRRACHASTFEGQIAPIEQWAHATWTRAGFPPYEWDRMYDLPNGGQGSPDALVADQPQSPAWYACDILDAIGFARGAIAAGRAEQAAVCGVQLGRLVTEALAHISGA